MEVPRVFCASGLRYLGACGDGLGWCGLEIRRLRGECSCHLLCFAKFERIKLILILKILVCSFGRS